MQQFKLKYAVYTCECREGKRWQRKTSRYTYFRFIKTLHCTSGITSRSPQFCMTLGRYLIKIADTPMTPFLAMRNLLRIPTAVRNQELEENHTSQETDATDRHVNKSIRWVSARVGRARQKKRWGKSGRPDKQTLSAVIGT